MTDKTTTTTRKPFDVRLRDGGADIWSGPTDNDIIFGTVYDKGPGSYDHEEMARVWATAYPVMFPALARIRDRARAAITTDGHYALLDLAWIAEEAAAALPGPTIGDLMNGTPTAAPSPAPAAPSAAQPDALASMAGLRDVDPLTFTYTNWRGETAVRRARPIRVYHGATEWHPEPQWLMEAYDADKGGLRAFAVKDMVFGAQPAQDMTETAKRIAWEMRDRLSVQYQSARSETPDDLWAVMTQADRRAALSAARAAQPAGEKERELVAAVLAYADSFDSFFSRSTCPPEYNAARSRIREAIGALRSGEGR